MDPQKGSMVGSSGFEPEISGFQLLQLDPQANAPHLFRIKQKQNADLRPNPG